jgi:hypothetical protein
MLVRSKLRVPGELGGDSHVFVSKEEGNDMFKFGFDENAMDCKFGAPSNPGTCPEMAVYWMLIVKRFCRPRSDSGNGPLYCGAPATLFPLNSAC